MKISIVTATLNNKAGLVRAIESVRSQSYKNVEHIIVDGGSTDGSVELIKNLELKIKNDENNRHFDSNTTQGNNLTSPLPTTHSAVGGSLLTISERDSGIYDAINKGIKLATGDVIGLLHSDDFFADDFVLEKYAEAFEQSAKRQAHSEVDAVYSDLVYVSSKTKNEKRKKNNIEGIKHSALNNEHSVIRYWKAQAQDFTTEAQRHRVLENGWMPPHPTLFIKKEVFDKYGLYSTDMKISADYEMILRLFYKHKIRTYYLPLTTYCMTIGGASNKSIKNILLKSNEDFRAMKMHGLSFPIFTLLGKNLRKLPQFFLRK